MTERVFNEQETIVLEKFKDFCLTNNLDKHGEYQDLDWYAFSQGFFLASGITNYDSVIDMALYARYTEHYWSNLRE